jgi:putative membrane protein
VLVHLLAHEPAAPSQLWTSWASTPSVVFVLATAGLAYANGLRPTRDRAALAAVVRRQRRAAIAAGVALTIALVSPVDAAAGTLLSAHMVQHLVLTAVAAPLLVVAAPIRTIRRGLRPRTQRVLDRLWVPVAGDAALRRSATLWATALFVATLSLWHLPSLYGAALESTAVHGIEHLTLLGAGVVFWWAVLAAARGTVLWAIIGLAVACVHGGALGALLALSPRPWYPLHASGAERWGVDPLADQQIAGAAMWVPTATIYVVAVAVVVHRWLARRDSGLGRTATGTEINAGCPP